MFNSMDSLMDRPCVVEFSAPNLPVDQGKDGDEAEDGDGVVHLYP